MCDNSSYQINRISHKLKSIEKYKDLFSFPIGERFSWSLIEGGDYVTAPWMVAIENDKI